MHRRIVLAAIALGLWLTGTAKADLAPPLPPAKESVAIKIEVDEKAKGPRLVVPNGVFTQPRVRPFPKKDDPKGELEQEKTDAIGGQNLIIVGLALTMSMAFGGLWLLRKNGKGSFRGLALLLAAGATLTIGAAVWANAPPPFKDRPVPKPPASYPIAYEGKAGVEFTYGQEPVRLILDKESYEKLKKGELKVSDVKPTPQ